ncbi:MAG TPA: hypothetical protein VF618_23925 [Thermoanaerobaculia bacterium]
MRSASALLLSTLLLLFASCATTTAPAAKTAAPEWDAIPSGVLDVFCRRLKSDAVGSGGGSVGIVTRTQPLVSASSLDSLQNAYFGRGNAARQAEALSAGQRMIPIALPQGSCAWQPMEAVDPNRYSDIMVVELSNALTNPYQWREAGLFARVSLAGRDASWYWIPLTRSGDTWTTGHILPLDLTDR